MLVEILSIVFISVIIVLSLLSFLLYLFVAKVLKNNIYYLSLILVLLLVIQFILGMLANLFAKIPQQEPWLVFHEFGFISVHTVNATILLILSVIFLFKTIPEAKTKYIGIIGLLGIMIAFASGVIFVNLGQNNIYSLTMSLGFITSFLAYTYQAFSLHQRQ